jgi:hypothetical protein
MAALAERVHAAAARGDDILNAGVMTATWCCYVRVTPARRSALGRVGAEFAESLDAVDELSPLRGEFLFPPTAAGSRYRAHSPQCLYFCGNSLGLQPKGVRVVLDEELRKWHLHGVEVRGTAAHDRHRRRRHAPTRVACRVTLWATVRGSPSTRRCRSRWLGLSAPSLAKWSR